MKVLVAPDKFKGSFSSTDVAEAIGEGIEAEVDLCPLADGGDGTAATLLETLGGEWVTSPAHDALGRPIEARYARLTNRTAVVDVAEASGLARLQGIELRPREASSAGTGELIAAAIAGGARGVSVACGGSAMTDAGLGALDRFDPKAADITCLCDISDPFMGALRYAPQKGADEADLEFLEDRLREAARTLPHDPTRLPFTGAAGGLAGGLWAYGARLVSGAQHVLTVVGFDRRLERADLVITGEGGLDETSLRGKLVGEVAARASAAGVPCHAFVGQDRLGPGRDRFASVAEAGTLAALAAAARRLDI